MPTRPSCKTMNQLWTGSDSLLVPGVTDMVSVRLAHQAGFEALFLSGYWCAASRFGLPDAGIVSYAQFLDQIRLVLETAPVELIADADTGFGSFTSLKTCAIGYEAAGVSAIQIEDQKFPKRCSISGASEVVSLDEMLQRIAVVVDHRKSDAFKLIARTDAKPEHGLQAAIDRGCAFVEAGADLVFVEGIETEYELERIQQSISVPIVYNYTPGSGIPGCTPGRLAELGARLILVPSEAALAGVSAMRDAYRLLANGNFELMEGLRRIDLKDVSQLVGLDDARITEAQYSKG